MKFRNVETIDQRICRLKALLRRLRAERKVAFFAEQHRKIKLQSKSKDEKNEGLA